MMLIISTCFEKLSEEEFVKPTVAIIEGTAKKDCVIRHYSKIKKGELKNFDKIIICGTALKDNDYLDCLEKFDWIRQIDKPVLGICSGMQIIGLKFGAKLAKSKEIGMEKIKSKIANPLFSEDFDAYELHSNGLRNLKNFDILAESKDCVQAIKHKTKKIYGIMFHPEVRNENIVKNFLLL